MYSCISWIFFSNFQPLDYICSPISLSLARVVVVVRSPADTAPGQVPRAHLADSVRPNAAQASIQYKPMYSPQWFRLSESYPTGSFPRSRPGHMGIADSRGVIYDFAGPYTIGEDNMAFGRPTRYLQLEPGRCKGEDWDEAVARSSDTYRCREDAAMSVCCAADRPVRHG